MSMIMLQGCAALATYQPESNVQVVHQLKPSCVPLKSLLVEVWTDIIGYVARQPCNEEGAV